MDANDLKLRTRAFSIRCLKLANNLPANISGRCIANQLARRGTSVGANYRAACRARSTGEFISKLGIVEEEADESIFWMELIVEQALSKPRLISPLFNEAEQLVKIVTSSIITARRDRRAPSSFRNPQSAIRNS